MPTDETAGELCAVGNHGKIQIRDARNMWQALLIRCEFRKDQRLGIICEEYSEKDVIVICFA